MGGSDNKVCGRSGSERTSEEKRAAAVVVTQDNVFCRRLPARRHDDRIRSFFVARLLNVCVVLLGGFPLGDALLFIVFGFNH